MDNEQLKNDQISIIALDDSRLEGIAGGVLDKDIANEWMDEVAYARFKANMTFEEVMAALAETDYSFTQQDMIELEGIARMIYNYK